jgi:predicted secreted protein
MVNHFYASPASISQGGSGTLNWKVTGADAVTIDHGLGTVSANGSLTVSPNETTVYKLTATNASGTTVADTSVTVSAIPLAAAVNMPVINHFESTPNSIMPGGIATLVWDVTGATSVSIDQGIGAVEVQGRKGVIPSGTTKYTLAAVNASGGVSASVNVVVTELTTSQPPEELLAPHVAQQVGVGKQFTISLGASPDTGFQWELDYYDLNFIALVGREYKPYTVPQAGSTGSQQFTFEAVKAGDTVIKLSYTHPDEPLNSSSKYYDVHVTP